MPFNVPPFLSQHSAASVPETQRLLQTWAPTDGVYNVQPKKDEIQIRFGESNHDKEERIRVALNQLRTVVVNFDRRIEDEETQRERALPLYAFQTKDGHRYHIRLSHWVDQESHPGQGRRVKETVKVFPEQVTQIAVSDCGPPKAAHLLNVVLPSNQNHYLGAAETGLGAYPFTITNSALRSELAQTFIELFQKLELPIPIRLEGMLRSGDDNISDGAAIGPTLLVQTERKRGIRPADLLAALSQRVSP